MAAWEAGFFTALNCLPMIIGSCANFLVIVSSLLFRSVRDIEGTSLFLVSLSVADFLVCAVYQPLLVIRFNQPKQDRFVVLTTSCFGFSLMTASMNGLLAVTFDRFVAIYLPLKYTTWMNKKNVALLISVSWLVALVTGISALSEVFGVKVICHLYATIIIMAVTILYRVIYKEARKQARQIINQYMQGTKNLPRRQHQVDRATRGVGLVLITTLLCWLPMLAVFPIIYATMQNDIEILKAVLWCLTPVCISSCINRPSSTVTSSQNFGVTLESCFKKFKGMLEEVSCSTPEDATAESTRWRRREITWMQLGVLVGWWIKAQQKLIPSKMSKPQYQEF